MVYCIEYLYDTLLEKGDKRAHAGNVDVDLPKGILVRFFQSCSIILLDEIPIFFPLPL